MRMIYWTVPVLLGQIILFSVLELGHFVILLIGLLVLVIVFLMVFLVLRNVWLKFLRKGKDYFMAHFFRRHYRFRNFRSRFRPGMRRSTFKRFLRRRIRTIMTRRRRNFSRRPMSSRGGYRL